ncbi:MAG: hypothetical protein R3F02_10805 [Thiolinea sp.]
MTDKAVKQYLQHYAEPEVRCLQHWPQHDQPAYRHVLVIPAYQESSDFLHRALQSAWFNRDILLILVINQPNTQTDISPQQQLFQYARSAGELIRQQQNLTLISTNTETAQNSGDILLVDRYTLSIPAKQGVGLARKIGADLALMLIDKGMISSDWICSTDADAILPDDYFSVLNTTDPDWIAACYAFEHVGGEPAVRQATLIYQQAMHYYVKGLQQAGSPYAHFTIGSTLAFKAAAYAQVRGFPKRAAGEDFYLLNKLIKTGIVGRIEQTVIKLQARLSDRVPFGTGMSTAKIIKLTEQGLPFCYYHPQSFIALQQVLQQFGSLWDARNDLAAWLEQLPEYSAELLLKAGLARFVETQRRQSVSKQQFDSQLVNWFDGLKTLQFIHGLRDRVYPDVPLEFDPPAE